MKEGGQARAPLPPSFSNGSYLKFKLRKKTDLKRHNDIIKSLFFFIWSASPRASDVFFSQASVGFVRLEKPAGIEYDKQTNDNREKKMSS